MQKYVYEFFEKKLFFSKLNSQNTLIIYSKNFKNLFVFQKVFIYQLERRSISLPFNPLFFLSIVYTLSLTIPCRIENYVKIAVKISIFIASPSLSSIRIFKITLNGR
jgi:hypothetical protein